MFNKILIANRGEIAVRVIRACRDMGIISAAVFSEADREALHTQIADEAVCIGPAVSSESYLNINNIISVAKILGADAIHPGFGFLAENADFAEKCMENGIVFIGPPPSAMRLMGDKIEARKTAAGAGVPVLQGSTGAVGSFEEAKHIADNISYPLMLKAAAGGGGRGIRLVDSPEGLKKAYDTASREAGASFGDNRIYIEKFIRNPRHIEFQILSDNYSNTVHLFERECSIQRRHQKLIEESPSPLLDESTRTEMGKASVKIAKAAGYANAGTVEFLMDSDKKYYFCEMNTRIQVEHPVTESVCGIDLVCEQIKIAAGLKLSFNQDDIRLSGHAIECRINAEDPAHNFAPCPGTIEAIHMPGGPGVRIDTAVYQGYSIPPYYDSMIGKLIVSAANRETAIHRMRRAIAEFLMDGITTNVDFLTKILKDEDFLAGNYDTGYLERKDFMSL